MKQNVAVKNQDGRTLKIYTIIENRVDGVAPTEADIILSAKHSARAERLVPESKFDALLFELTNQPSTPFIG